MPYAGRIQSTCAARTWNLFIVGCWPITRPIRRARLTSCARVHRSMSTQDNNRGIYVPAQTFLVGVVTFLMAVLLALFSLTINIVRDHTVNIAMLHGRLS